MMFGPANSPNIRSVRHAHESTMRTIFFAAGICVTLAVSGIPSALAQSFPAKPVRIVVPFPPGGGGDTVGRVVAQRLTESWGQPVIIENRPGGNTIIAAEFVAKSPPDGYMLFLAIDSSLTMNPSLYRKLPYNPETDLAPISMINSTALILTANPKFPAKSVKELVAYAKANPGKVNIGSGALGAQLGVELFKLTTGTDMVYVSFKGSGPTFQALLAGDIDLALADITTFGPPAKEGRLTGIATTGLKRDVSVPNVPTVHESGYPGFEVRAWFGLFAAGGTPRPIIDRIHEELVKTLTQPAVRAQFLALGREVIVSTPEELAAAVRTETARWAPLIKSLGVRLD
ncbi:MAG: tripartite tricarboxylate transporter substrate binding protein [Betaproteobacteria bacterium]|nr:tripartite tricarboxylate transporter substrate binding protein [Betaproteobacteria bacterium]